MGIEKCNFQGPSKFQETHKEFQYAPVGSNGFGRCATRSLFLASVLASSTVPDLGTYNVQALVHHSHIHLPVMDRQPLTTTIVLDLDGYRSCADYRSYSALLAYVVLLLMGGICLIDYLCIYLLATCSSYNRHEHQTKQIFVICYALVVMNSCFQNISVCYHAKTNS